MGHRARSKARGKRSHKKTVCMRSKSRPRALLFLRGALENNPHEHDTSSVPPLTSVARLMCAHADAITGPPLEPAPQKQLKSQNKTQNAPGAGQKEVEPDTPPL
jgi:hypothetical protein